MTIPVVDIFAGPGGLGEGFSALECRSTRNPLFRISISAEMERNAAQTLRLRAFFRQFPRGHAPSSYYDYVVGRAPVPWTERTRTKWETACDEALQLKLGNEEDDRLLRRRIANVAASGNPWVLIGGPPCQAYSLVGRARNAGIVGYRPESDDRHFLYRHYLKIVSRYQPAAFVMENVKGMLSSKVDGSLIFPQLLEDLHRPGGRRGKRYRVIPLVESGSGDVLEANAYIVRSEQFGIPQARHRVILLGLAEDIPFPKSFLASRGIESACVQDVLSDMPHLRSSITDAEIDTWPRFAKSLLIETARKVRRPHRDVAQRLMETAEEVGTTPDPGCGERLIPYPRRLRGTNTVLDQWLFDPRLEKYLNHRTRGHMQTDLMRYAFAAAFAEEHGRSPRGHIEFPESLAPEHANWSSGKFLDRFRVQAWGAPSSTITSHLSKDGHYFIHPDAGQLRSFSVREAARLQTFPDNYFFEGPTGAQYRQVGNAVPPLLAKQIAKVVHAAISR